MQTRSRMFQHFHEWMESGNHAGVRGEMTRSYLTCVSLKNTTRQGQKFRFENMNMKILIKILVVVLANPWNTHIHIWYDVDGFEKWMNCAYNVIQPHITINFVSDIMLCEMFESGGAELHRYFCDIFYDIFCDVFATEFSSLSCRVFEGDACQITSCHFFTNPHGSPTPFIHGNVETFLNLSVIWFHCIHFPAFSLIYSLSSATRHENVKYHDV